MKMNYSKYEIRIFNERYNVDYSYYSGDKDIKYQFSCDSPEVLFLECKKLIKQYEGDTYCIWNHSEKEIIVGGAFDPSDLSIIMRYFGVEENPQDEYTTWFALRLKDKKDMEITEHLAMNGYTFDTNGDDVIFIYEEEVSYLETILNDHYIKYERM